MGSVPKAMVQSYSKEKGGLSVAEGKVRGFGVHGKHPEQRVVPVEVEIGDSGGEARRGEGNLMSLHEKVYGRECVEIRGALLGSKDAREVFHETLIVKVWLEQLPGLLGIRWGVDPFVGCKDGPFA